MARPPIDLVHIETQARKLKGLSDAAAPGLLVSVLCLVIEELRTLNRNLSELDKSLMFIRDAIQDK